MIALHESLVEWTALALGVAVAAALLVRMRGMTARPSRWPWLPGLALVAIAAHAGIAVNAAAAAVAEAGQGATAGQPVGDGAAALRLAAIAVSACLAVLLAAWLYLNRSLRVLPTPALDDEAGDGCMDCPQCAQAGLESTESQSRRRARGLTMTRLGGG